MRPGRLLQPRATVHTELQQHSPQKSGSRGTAVPPRSLLGAVSIHKKHRNILSSVLSLPLCYSKADPAALTSTTPWGDDLQDHFHLTLLVSCTTTGIAVGCRSNVSRTHRSLLSHILA